jgi:hypothetical protein
MAATMQRLCLAGIFATILGVISSGSAYALPCFTPLADSKSKDTANWKDLEDFSPQDAQKAPNVIQFLRLSAKETRGKVNVDFYKITFAKHPSKTVDAFFKEMRQNFDRFSLGADKVFGFKAFDGYTRAGGPDEARNNAAWNQDLPLNALMSFNLDTGAPAIMKAVKTWYFIERFGDVQVTCASSTDFILSTVETSDPVLGAASGHGLHAAHPVAGNRGFGIMDNGDGTWSFYSKGVDRDSGTTWNLQMDMFEKGRTFWQSFYGGMQDYLNGNGMAVKALETENNQQVPYPF